jgi:hypothetical protein
MKDRIELINDLINDAEKIIESAFVRQIEENKDFKEVYLKVGDSTEKKELKLNYELKKINKDTYQTIITNKDKNEDSINLLIQSDIGGIKNNIPAKGIFKKIKKNVIKELKKDFSNFKIS